MNPTTELGWDRPGPDTAAITMGRDSLSNVTTEQLQKADGRNVNSNQFVDELHPKRNVARDLTAKPDPGAASRWVAHLVREDRG